MTSRNSARSTHRTNIENEMIRKREKEHKHQTEWGNRVQYYKTFDKSNNKYEQWTSPRYYEENAQLMGNIRKKRDKEELTVKRREKLLKLYQEEEASYKIELMVKNKNNYLKPRNKSDDLPTEILDVINKGLKLEDEDRRRHQAELSLYEHWRRNNHNLRNYERRIRTNDVKLSWLDQQIQKRMEREKQEEEYRKMLAERDKQIEQQKKEEDAYKKYLELKNKELKSNLDNQLIELNDKKRQSEKLELEENEYFQLQRQVDVIEEKQVKEEKQREERQIALFNIRQHKLKLKQRAKDIEKSLDEEADLAEEMLKLDLKEKLENNRKINDVQKTLREFVQYAREQKQLEKKRQETVNFIFDSEAKLMCERQCEIWQKEEASRKTLLKDVLDIIKQQIKEKEDKHKVEYLETLNEREEMLKNIEKCNDEMEHLKQEELRKNTEYKNIIDKQIKERELQRKQLKCLERSDIENQLESNRKEEERLKNEIMKLQKRREPISYRKTRIF